MDYCRSPIIRVNKGCNFQPTQITCDTVTKIVYNISSTIKYIDIYLTCPASSYCLPITIADCVSGTDLYINNIFVGNPPCGPVQPYIPQTVVPVCGDAKSFMTEIKLENRTVNPIKVWFTGSSNLPQYANYKFMTTNVTWNNASYDVVSDLYMRFITSCDNKVFTMLSAIEYN